MAEEQERPARECRGGPLNGESVTDPNRRLKSARVSGEITEAPRGRYVAMVWEQKPVYVWVNTDDTGAKRGGRD